MSVTDQPVQAPEAQGQPATPPVVGTGPWAQDLASLFPDDSTRGTVDKYLREKWQPHTTQLEQRLAAQQQAVGLWEALEKDPTGTYIQITREMMGDQAADQLLAQLQTPATADAPTEAPVDPRMAQAVEFFENEQASRQYDGELGRIKAAYPDIVDDVFHSFVAAAEGNFDQAVTLYYQAAARFAPVVEAPPVEQQTAPPALGSDTGTPVGDVPVQPKRQTLDEAMADFMAEQRAAKQAPPVMG
jgi:hypothetical protein